MVESLANRKLRQLAATKASVELLDDYWNFLRRENTLHKLDGIVTHHGAPAE